MINTTLEILIALLLIVTNGVFAMSETAVVSARQARLQKCGPTKEIPRHRQRLN